MNLNDILADKKTFTDDMEIVLGNEKVSLGQIRDFSSRQQKDLSDKIQAAEAKERTFAANATKAAELISALEDTQKKLVATKAQPQPNEDDSWKDDWWNPVRKQLTERDRKIEQLMSTVDNLSKSIEKSATIWAHDRWRSQFDKVSPRLKKVDKFKDWDYDKTLEYAAANKLNDQYGFPSIEKAVLELTKEDEVAAARREGYEAGKKEGTTAGRMANMVKPSSATGGKVPAKGKTSVEEFGFEGLGDDVANDSDLMEKIAQLQDLDLGTTQ